MSILLKASKYSEPNSLVNRLRRRRSAHVMALIDRIFAEKGSCSIIDIGGTRRYWNLFDADYLRARNCRVLIVNLAAQQADDDLFSFAPGDAADLSAYADGSFDLAHSNSVIEHMILWEKMRAFADEARRLAPRYFIQTPYFWFPVEPHFLLPFVHWLPASLAARMLLRWTPKRRPADLNAAMMQLQGSRMLDRKQFRFLFPDARIATERLALLPKSLMAIRD